jgi:hypothetical protein
MPLTFEIVGEYLYVYYLPIKGEEVWQTKYDTVRNKVIASRV